MSVEQKSSRDAYFLIPSDAVPGEHYHGAIAVSVDAPGEPPTDIAPREAWLAFQEPNAPNEMEQDWQKLQERFADSKLVLRIAARILPAVLSFPVDSEPELESLRRAETLIRLWKEGAR